MLDVKIAKAPGWTALEAGKQLQTYATENFTLPGEPGFPLNSLYAAPANRSEAGEFLLPSLPLINYVRG